LSEETVVVICPNPKCRREIQEPITLAILSATPPKKFKACPYCFTDLTPEPEIEKEIIPEPAVEDEEVLDEIEENVDSTDSETSSLEKDKSGPSFLQRVKSLIPSRSNDTQKEVEKLQDEADTIEEEMVTEKELTPELNAVEEPEEVPTSEPLVEDKPEELEETEELEKAEEAEELEEPEEPEEAPTIEEPETKEAESSGCPEEFGYLANRPPDTPIPSRCLVCPKMVDCMLSPRDE